MRQLIGISLVVFLSACSAELQISDFIDRQPDPNLIFADNFENGLGKWSQASGTWSLTTPGFSGLALTSPTSTTLASFSISTLTIIDLAGKSGCFLEYDTRYLIKGISGVSANVLFGSNIVGTFKDTSATVDVSSASAYVHRKVALADGSSGRISFATSVTNDTTGYADWRIDNISVKCSQALSATVMVFEENFDSSAADWSLLSLWAYNAIGGFGGAGGLRTNSPSQNAHTGISTASYIPAISLTRTFGCQVQFYYNHINSAAVNCLSLDWNNNQIWASCGTGSAGTQKVFLTAYEDSASNMLRFRCIDSNGALGGNNTCVVDQLQITCQQ